MSFLERLFSGEKTGQTDENINKLASQTASDIIKQLSGAEMEKTKKVIDNLIVVTNSSGGAGASTVVSNVAWMADKKGFKVLVIDLNIMYPIQHSYFGVRQVLEKPDLVSYLLGRNELGRSLETIGNISLLYANNRNLADSINCKEDAAVTNLEIALDKARQLYDLVIVDAPMEVDDILSNTAFYLADSIYLVWDEGISSIANTERIRRNMAVSGIDAYSKMRVVLNKRTNIHYSNFPFDRLNIELVQVLPFDTAIIEGSLRSIIFCDKGASSSTNANDFYTGIESLTDKILEYGGYVG